MPALIPAARRTALPLAPRAGLLPVMLLALLAAGCASDEIECIIDSECPTGQYCVSTRCADPTPVGDPRTAYVEQVAVVIETGCNCHGPTSGRPWTYDHRFAEPAVFDESLRLFRQWLYDPIGGRPAAAGYGLADCGDNHPGIYDGPDQPQYQLIARWAAAAYDSLPPSLPADHPAAPVAPPPDTPLPDRERIERARIQAEGYVEVTRSIIAPRVVGQCSCCHVLGSSRRWQIPAGRDLSETQLDAVMRALESYVDRRNPDQSAMLRYGLGDLGREQAHPVVFTGVDDPRYRLLRAWIAEGEPPPRAP